jgi:hypothetical protein
MEHAGQRLQKHPPRTTPCQVYSTGPAAAERPCSTSAPTTHLSPSISRFSSPHVV